MKKALLISILLIITASSTTRFLQNEQEEEGIKTSDDEKSPISGAIRSYKLTIRDNFRGTEKKGQF